MYICQNNTGAAHNWIYDWSKGAFLIYWPICGRFRRCVMRILMEVVVAIEGGLYPAYKLSPHCKELMEAVTYSNGDWAPIDTNLIHAISQLYMTKAIEYLLIRPELAAMQKGLKHTQKVIYKGTFRVLLLSLSTPPYCPLHSLSHSPPYYPSLPFSPLPPLHLFLILVLGVMG